MTVLGAPITSMIFSFPVLFAPHDGNCWVSSMAFFLRHHVHLFTFSLCLRLPSTDERSVCNEWCATEAQALRRLTV